MRLLSAAQTLDVRGLRVGWSPDLGFAVVDPEVVAVAEAAAARLVEPPASCGVRSARSQRTARRLVVRAGAARAAGSGWTLPSPRRLLDDEVRYVLDTGRLELRRAGPDHQRRASLQRRLAALFDEIDVLCTPATACVAFKAEDADITEIRAVMRRAMARSRSAASLTPAGCPPFRSRLGCPPRTADRRATDGARTAARMCCCGWRGSWSRRRPGR